MPKIFSMRNIIVLVIILLIFSLSLNFSRELRAQNVNKTFVDFMKPYVNAEISISSSRGIQVGYNGSAILREIGSDYIIVEIRSSQFDPSSTEVIALNSIYSMTLGEKPQIHFNRP